MNKPIPARFFLDELGDASLGVQTRLLRVLEEREVRRVGSERVLPISVRVITATNKNLNSMMRNGTFRDDLFYRICVCPVSIPPLRERKEDILLLIRHIATENHSRTLTISKHLEAFINAYDWPGNVRELQNVVAYLCTAANKNTECTISDLPKYLLSHAKHPHVQSVKLDIDHVYSELHEIGLASFCARILSAYNETETGKPLGRGMLIAVLAKSGSAISQYAVRKCLGILKQYGMILCGATKQGTRITAAGIDFLNYVESQQKHP